MNLFRRCRHNKVLAHSSQRSSASGKITAHMTCLKCGHSLKQDLGKVVNESDIIREVLDVVMQAKGYTVRSNATYERT